MARGTRWAAVLPWVTLFFCLASPLLISTPQSSSPGPSTHQSSSLGPSTPQSSSPGPSTHQSSSLGPSTSQSSSPGPSTHQSSSPGPSTHQSSSLGPSTPQAATLSNNSELEVLIDATPQAATLSNNSELQVLIDAFFTNNDQLLNLYELLNKMVESILNKMVESMSKEGTFTSCSRDVLTSFMVSLENMGNNITVVLANQEHIMESQMHYGDTLDAEVHVITRRKDGYYNIYAYLAAFFMGGTLFAVKFYPKSLSLSVVFAVFAAIASALSYCKARQSDTYQDELMVPVTKRKGIIEVIIGDNRLAQYHLASMKALINDLHSQVNDILGMVDSAMGSKLEAFNLTFQKLVSKVDRCSKDANSSRQGVVQTINKNWD